MAFGPELAERKSNRREIEEGGHFTQLHLAKTNQGHRCESIKTKKKANWGKEKRVCPLVYLRPDRPPEARKRVNVLS